MIPFSAIDLQVLQGIYETDLLPYLFCYALSDDRIVHLTFEQSQWSHLLGVQKVDPSRADLRGQSCYDEIKNGTLTFNKLKSINRGAVARHCKDKMRYFDELPSLLLSPECVSYEASASERPTKNRMSLALYAAGAKASRRLILGIDRSAAITGEERQAYFPRTWLIEKTGSASILDHQTAVQIVCVARKNRVGETAISKN